MLCLEVRLVQPVVLELGEEKTIAAAEDCPLGCQECKSGARRQVVLVGRPPARQPWLELDPLALRSVIEIIADAQIRGQAWRDLPIVLIPRRIDFALEDPREVADGD